MVQNDIDVVTKTKFAELSGVTQARVSQWISRKQIHGEALVTVGRSTQIRVSVAQQQLKKNLDLSQRLGANGRVKFDDDPENVDTLEDEIKRARLAQLELSNEHARALREVQAGRFVRSDDVSQEMGRIAGRMLGLFEGALGELATAVAAKSNLPARDALHILRTTFRTIRERVSNTEAGIAKALPPSVDEEARP
jgi:DNA-binding transcriptional regulator YdaS (Cro superfamily)